PSLPALHLRLFGMCPPHLALRYLPFFFFQAEDGIRGFHVTGVQTCALPILFDDVDVRHSPALQAALGDYFARHGVASLLDAPVRSEERRVGKERGTAREGWD